MIKGIRKLSLALAAFGVLGLASGGFAIAMSPAPGAGVVAFYDDVDCDLFPEHPKCQEEETDEGQIR